ACWTRKGNGLGWRNAVTGAAGGNGEEDAGRTVAAGHAGPSADNACTAAKYARPAWPGRKVSRIAGRSAARSWKEEVIPFHSSKGLKMSLVIRLARAGTKKRPVYHVVVADNRAPRDGRFIERLGYFNPLLPKEKTERLKLAIEKVQAWMKKGAQPSDRVMRFLEAAGIMKRPKRNNPEKAIPRKERKAKEEEAAKTAGAAPAAEGDAKAAAAKAEKPAEAAQAA